MIDARLVAHIEDAIGLAQYCLVAHTLWHSGLRIRAVQEHVALHSFAEMLAIVRHNQSPIAGCRRLAEPVAGIGPGVPLAVEAHEHVAEIDRSHAEMDLVARLVETSGLGIRRFGQQE